MKSVTFVLPGMGLGGVERTFLELLRTAPRKEMELTLLLLSPGGELLDQVPDWVRVRVDESAGRLERVRSRASALLKRSRMDGLFTAAKKLYHRVGPALLGGGKSAPQGNCDVAVAFSDGLAAWYTAEKLQAGKKYAFVHTDVEAAGYSAAAEREIYGGFERIFFITDGARAGFLRLLPDLAIRTSVLAMGVDGARIRAGVGETPEEMRRPGLKIVTVGRLSREKGVRKIPEILSALLRDGLEVTWFLVGDGPEREALSAEIRRRKLEGRLILTGARDDPYSYMAACDLYVQPSDYEGYCLALGEACALGKPCVACRFPDAGKHIEDGVTGLVTGFSAGELACGIEELLTSPQKRETMAEALRCRRSETTPDEVTALWWSTLLS